jgi:hypothetical protein
LLGCAPALLISPKMGRSALRTARYESPQHARSSLIPSRTQRSAWPRLLG